MGSKPVSDVHALEISHVTVVNGLVVIAYLASRTVEFYESADCQLPMDDIYGKDILFQSKMEHEFVRGEVFTLVDHETESTWTCQVVKPEDNDFRFVARVVPIPPLESYADNDETEEAPAKPRLMVVAKTDKA